MEFFKCIYLQHWAYNYVNYIFSIYKLTLKPKVNMKNGT